MVSPVDSVARHFGPRPGRRVPDLGREGRSARVRVGVLAPAAAAGREDPAVGQDRQIVVLAREIHRPRAFPDRRAGREVDDLRGVRRRNGGSASIERPVDAAGDQDLSRRIHRGRAPVARSEDVRAHDTPRAGTRRVQVARRRTRARIEDLAVWSEEHVRVVGLLKLRARQSAPGPTPRLEHLGKRIPAHGRVLRSGDDENVAIRERHGRRVPASRVHVRLQRPGIRRSVVDRSGRKPDVVRDVSAGDEQPTVGERGKTGTEDVVPRLRRRGDRSGADGVELREIRVIVRVPEQDLVRGKQDRMDRSIRPRRDRRPLPDDGGLREKAGDPDQEGRETREKNGKLPADAAASDARARCRKGARVHWALEGRQGTRRKAR